MTRKIWISGAAVFILTLLLNLPAAFIARFVDWPPGWQPQVISGTLWTGRMERLGSVGPIAWTFRPWAGRSQVSAGFQQQDWALSLNGWPWAWQAELIPGAPLVTPTSGYVLDGHWRGRVIAQGRALRCLSSEGEVYGEDMALLLPWTMVVGKARFRLECRDAMQLLAEVQRHGEHRFEARLDPFARRLNLSGRVEPDASVTPLLIQAGLLKPGAGDFARVFGNR